MSSAWTRVLLYKLIQLKKKQHSDWEGESKTICSHMMIYVEKCQKKKGGGDAPKKMTIAESGHKD